jgi:hypothetical protein
MKIGQWHDMNSLYDPRRICKEPKKPLPYLLFLEK